MAPSFGFLLYFYVRESEIAIIIIVIVIVVVILLHSATHYPILSLVFPQFHF